MRTCVLSYCARLTVLFKRFASSAGTKSASPEDPHKGEGFLKAAWHRLTNQHHKPVDDASEKKDSESKSNQDHSDNNNDSNKKASGSG